MWNNLQTIGMGFASIVLMPLLSVLSIAKKPVLPWLVGIWIAWTLGLLALAGSGITPMGPGDIVTPQQIDAWFSGRIYKFATTMCFIGFVTGIPLIAITWVYEHHTLSKPIKLVLAAIKLGAFAGALWCFASFFVLPLLNER